ncbi:DsbA family protein [Dichotomicrobium thermohalophilum]|uniref:Protein-disulfide isomerase n=1 Tax=Dichotomicrobium thermohalophilum TaxID=933063 RepID=A0A397Q3H4_9HYPH|nr:DsbA family protein [Dichotomicrobium thermohalophilum]RIA55473.1 protein-disulfide isomerase [Dichotomicrobium thermohalophilum]
MKKLVIAAAVLAVSTLFTIQPRAATTDQFNDEQEKAIQEIVRSYLLKNPELLEEVIAELQKKREAEAAVARQEYLRELYSADSKYKRFSMGKGDVVVVEFMDYNCPFCRKAYATLRDLMDETDIEVRLIEFPVLGPGSTVASQAALAAEKQGKYVEFHDALMSLSQRIENEETIFKVAEEVGLDVDQLKTDMQDPEINALIDENLQLADALGVQGTPAFFVGDTSIPGAPENLRDELITAIAEAREGCAAC